MIITASRGSQSKVYEIVPGGIPTGLNLYRVMYGNERPDIGWLGRPNGTFDNVPLCENMRLEKGAGITIPPMQWDRIVLMNPASAGATQKEKIGWLVSSLGTDKIIFYNEATGTYRQHTPEVAGGATVNVLEIQGNFAKVGCWNINDVIPENLPMHFVYTWTALTLPKPGYPIGQTFIPRDGVKFPILYWRNWAYLPLQWLVKL